MRPTLPLLLLGTLGFAQAPSADLIKTDPKAAMLAFAEHARTLDPKDGHVLAQVGRAHLVAGDRATAERWFAEAVKREPKDGEVQLLIAKAWVDVKLPAKALECLKYAREKAPDKFGVLCDFAVLMMDAGEIAAAEETFAYGFGHEPKMWARATAFGRACLRAKRQDLAAKAWAQAAPLARNQENFWNEVALSLGDGGVER